MTVEAAITRLARDDASRVLAILADRFGDVDIADDAVQDALLEAARVWPERGIPRNPTGWLVTVARRKAIDQIRSAGSERRRALDYHLDAVNDDAPVSGGAGMLIDDDHWVDNSPGASSSQLRLLLLCCHPSLDPESRVALTLRLVGGLSTAETAAAFLVPETTLSQRIVRAKRKIRTAGIPMSMPARIDDRMSVLLQILYLIFNEGYRSNSRTQDVVTRPDLSEVSVRLTRLVVDLAPGHSEAQGLLALQLYTLARSRTRADDEGNLIVLAAQDRTKWDRPLIAEANQWLQSAMGLMQPGPMQVQALIMSYHANAESENTTDWVAIAQLYRQLEQMTQSDVVRMNRAVAVAMADGPLAGLGVLDGVEGLENHHRFQGVRAELLHRAERHQEALKALERALDLAPPSEARFLGQRIQNVRQVLNGEST